MKSKKHNISIRELFRQKLEDVEVVPDASVNLKLMRRLAVQEFLHFNPVRFNIYYLGISVIAIILFAIVLSSGSENPEKLTPLNIYQDMRTDSAIFQVDRTVSHKSEKANPEDPQPIKIIPDMKTKDISVDDSAGNPATRLNDGVNHTEFSDSFINKKIFPSATDKIKLQSGMRPATSLFETSASEGCTPLKLRFYSKSDSYDSCRWTFGDGGYSNEKNPEWIFDVEGEYKVVLDLFGSDGSHKTSSSVITVLPKPLARFEITPDKAVLPEDEVRFYNYSSDATHFNWDFGDGDTSELFEPQHKYAKSGNYNVRLIVSSDWGCSDSLIVLNAFSGSEYFINFPNAFIPNPQGPSGGFYSSRSDENAQVFHPVFYGISDYQLKIFSKMGILIFESNDFSIGWDGYLNGQLSAPGVYIWKVRGNFRNGEPFTRMGDVTLLRN